MQPNSINFIPHLKIDISKWDECIDKSLNSLIYAKSWYLDIVSPGWHCIEIDNYKAVFPLPTRKKYNIKYIYSPYFVQQLGLFFTDEYYNNASILTEVINKIPPQFRLIHLYLNEFNKVSSQEYEINQRMNFLLELNNSYEDIRKGYSHGLKSNLKSAEKNNIEVSNSRDTDLIVKFYKKNTGDELNKFKKENYNILEKLLYIGLKKDCIEMKSGYYKNELIAVAVFLFYKNRITYLLSSSTLKGKKLSAMPFILDKVIRDYSNKPYIFDFEGSMVESIAKFFRSFGSTESVYLQLKINRLHRLIRWLKE